MSASDYPTAVDTFVNPAPDSPRNAPSLSATINKLHNATRAIQLALGSNPQGEFSDVVARLNDLADGLTGLAAVLDEKSDIVNVVLRAGSTMTGNLILPNMQFGTGSVATTGTVNLDFDGPGFLTQGQLSGNVSYTTSNLGPGKSISVRVTNGSTLRSLTFPAGWKFVGEKPVEIEGNKTGILAITSFSTTDSNVVAAWAVQE